MPLGPLAVTDTRFFFRPLARELIQLLGALPPLDWNNVAVGHWLVRDVVAHLVDTTARRLSFHRDGLESRGAPAADGPAFTAFINRLNADWIAAAQRLSPRVLGDTYTLLAMQLADFVEGLPPDAPPLYPVSWAGEDGGHAGLDIGRDFTEQWHHQMQIRDAVGAPGLAPEWLHATVEIGLRALPHAYRDVPATTGATLLIDVTGAGGGRWTLRRDPSRWTLLDGAPENGATATATLSGDTAWRLLFNRLTAADTARRVETSGDPTLASALLMTRSVIV